MTYKVILYDHYNNIPLRGIIETDSSTLAFSASILDDEPDQIADRPGVYSRIQAFEYDEALKLLLEERHDLFLRWRARFDAGQVDRSTHPLYVDPRYRELSTRIDELFGRLGPQVFEANGLMRVVSGSFVFESL